MGKTQHKLYCEGCDDVYYWIGDGTWYTSGTVSRWTGYCPSCCGKKTQRWTWTGHVVKLRCKECNCTYGVISWYDWRNLSSNKIGFCEGCFQQWKEKAFRWFLRVVQNSLTVSPQPISLDVMPPVPPRYVNSFANIAYTTDNNLTTKFYDFEFRQDNSDEIQFSLERRYIHLYTMDSPNSITLNFEDNHDNKSITIEFGCKGSNVHVAVSLDTYKNDRGYRSMYHFGLLLSGNTYTVKDNTKGTKSVKHYMMIHLMKDDIVFMLCKSYKRAMTELNSVWGGNPQHGQISHYHKIIGHSVLSASVICKFLVKEQDEKTIPYEFKELKDHHEYLSIYYPRKQLAAITNCFLFVIRFAKLLDQAHTKKIEIPSAKDIVDWTIGKQKWHNSDIFNHIWDHSKAFATF